MCTGLLPEIITSSCYLLMSLLISGIQTEGISRLGWLMAFQKHAICTDSLYFLHLLLVSIWKILALFQLLSGGLHWHAGPIWILPDASLSDCLSLEPHN
jgi:hypothetical protein